MQCIAKYILKVQQQLSLAIKSWATSEKIQ